MRGSNSNWNVVKIGLEVGTQMLVARQHLDILNKFFFMEGYLVISCFRLNFLYNKALLVELKKYHITVDSR